MTGRLRRHQSSLQSASAAGRLAVCVLPWRVQPRIACMHTEMLYSSTLKTVPPARAMSELTHGSSAGCIACGGVYGWYKSRLLLR